MISEDTLDKVDDAIEDVLLKHCGDDNECHCGARNNMDGDVLHGHRLCEFSDAVRKALEPQHDSTDNLTDDEVIKAAVVSLQLWQSVSLSAPNRLDYRDSAQKWLALAHHRLGQL